MATKFKTVDEYIASFPADVQKVLETIRQTIKSEITNGGEVISYNIPAVTNGKDPVIYFSAWKKHSSLYPFTEAMAKEFPETSEYNTSGKGTIQFSYDQPLPIELIKKIVRFRLQEISKEQ